MVWHCPALQDLLVETDLCHPTQRSTPMPEASNNTSAQSERENTSANFWTGGEEGIRIT
jgi:hypothetical protein